jgi:dsDNA-specific endonuclease/ATPase MutS2
MYNHTEISRSVGEIYDAVQLINREVFLLSQDLKDDNHDLVNKRRKRVNELHRKFNGMMEDLDRIFQSYPR